MKVFKWSFVLSLIVILSSFTGIEDYKTISKAGVTLQYPSNWDSMVLEGYPILVKERAKTTEYSVECTFVVEVDNNFKDLDTFFKMYDTKMKNSPYFKNYKIESQKTLKYRGYDCLELISTSAAGGFNFKTKVLLIAQKDRILNINTTSSVADFENNKVITDRIYESVELSEEYK